MRCWVFLGAFLALSACTASRDDLTLLHHQVKQRFSAAELPAFEPPLEILSPAILAAHARVLSARQVAQHHLRLLLALRPLQSAHYHQALQAYWTAKADLARLLSTN